MLLLAALLAGHAAGHLKASYLRCENHVAPLAISESHPSLSWELSASLPSLRNVSQSAYRIVAATSENKLRSKNYDLWDSGTVKSNATFEIPYGGKALSSGEGCYWQVETWDEKHVPSWSDSTFFYHAIAAQDWKASWIEHALNIVPDRIFGGANWIWSDKDTQGSVPKVTRTFKKTFNISSNDIQTPVLINITADDQFKLEVNGKLAAQSNGEEDSWKKPVSKDLKPFLKTGDNTLVVTVENTSVGYAGLLAHITYGSNTIVTDSSWTVDDSAPATVLGKANMQPWGQIDRPAETNHPAIYLRKKFVLPSKKVVKAFAYVTALGLVDFYLNGSRVSDDLFTPGWSDYSKRVYYKTYDVSDLLSSGKNTIGAILGDGWYSGYVGYARQRNLYGERPRLKAQIIVTYADGSHKVIGSDSTWEAGTGHIVSQDFLRGEIFDARKNLGMFTSSTDKLLLWDKASIYSGFAPQVETFAGEPVRIFATKGQVSTHKVASDTYIINFGQNLAGFVKLSTLSHPGQKITLRFGERLNPDGTLYTTNLRSASSTDVYYARGGMMSWEPRFTFHGFQYAEVTGLGHAPKPGEVVAEAISSATPEIGHIATSDPMINKLSSNAWWTQKANFIDIPTDCPQRDERLGWMGDAQVYIKTASYYSDIDTFFRKWLEAVDDGQSKSGEFPSVAPLKVSGPDGGPGWADAGVICPTTAYTRFGDIGILKQNYPAMKRYADFYIGRSTSDMLPPKNFFCFGDWVSLNADTPTQIVYMAYLEESVSDVAQAADTLGYKEDAKKYWAIVQRVKEAFTAHYVNEQGEVVGKTQCSYVLALHHHLLPDNLAKLAAQHLVEDIEHRKWHLSTGFLGTKELMTTLSEIGRNDVAFRLLHNTTYPSWGYEIKNGATSIWERWDGWSPQRGFQDPGMNSFAHYANGAVMGWVFEQIGGISPTSVGFKTIAIQPVFDPNLTYASTEYRSIAGMIHTSWHRTGKKVFITVDVPPNVSADVSFSNLLFHEATSKEQMRTAKIGSGAYRFVVDSETAR